jgi:hypothetical protein
MGAVLPFKSPLSVDDAWQRYVDLVNERHDKNLWTDVEHNQRLARAWEAWATLFNATERVP